MDKIMDDVKTSLKDSKKLLRLLGNNLYNAFMKTLLGMVKKSDGAEKTLLFPYKNA